MNLSGARLPSAMSGHEFAATLPDKWSWAREGKIVTEAMDGNIPDFMRTFCEVNASGRDTTGAERKLKLYVLPDYLSIGSDEDFVRVPLCPKSAQEIADKLQCMLPTKKMVDIVWAAAAVKLPPRGIQWDDKMETTSRFLQHEKMVEKDRLGKPLGALTDGHKKNIAITNKLLDANGKFRKMVAIYGFHQLNGVPIQGLNAFSHDDSYTDYSHGTRLFSLTCELEGSQYAVKDVLQDPVLCGLLSDEGPLRLLAYPRCNLDPDPSTGI